MSIGIVLARLQPIHNGHIELIKKAARENDKAYLFIGSANKVNKCNPLPIWLRIQLATEATKDIHNLTIVPLDDLNDEANNDHDWGFYLYSNIVSVTREPCFTIYYSDGFEIITTWFPGFILRNNVSLNLLARNACENGVCATYVRQLIESNDEKLKEVVPRCVYELRETIKNHINLVKIL